MSATEDVPEDDSVCFYCGYPDCRCNDSDPEDERDDEEDFEDEMCPHGYLPDEECEECDFEEYESHRAPFGPLPS